MYKYIYLNAFERRSFSRIGHLPFTLFVINNDFIISLIFFNQSLKWIEVFYLVTSARLKKDLWLDFILLQYYVLFVELSFVSFRNFFFLSSSGIYNKTTSKLRHRLQFNWPNFDRLYCRKCWNTIWRYKQFRWQAGNIYIENYNKKHRQSYNCL